MIFVDDLVHEAVHDLWQKRSKYSFNFLLFGLLINKAYSYAIFQVACTVECKPFRSQIPIYSNAFTFQYSAAGNLLQKQSTGGVF